MAVSPAFSASRLKRLRRFGKLIAKLFPNLKNELRRANIEIYDYYYMLSAVISAIFLSLILTGFILALSFFIEKPINEALLIGLGTFLGGTLLLTLLFSYYPSIIAKKRAAEIDKHLMYALKDLLLHTVSGASLFDSMVSVAKSDYGMVSLEFEKVAKAINSGTSEDKALEDLAKRTESLFLQKVVWQLVNTLRAGGNIQRALNSIVQDLVVTQRANIVGYANELNLWSLIYMLFAVAAPTIGITLIIILSSFADIGINENMLIGFVTMTSIIQFVIIGLIKSRRPYVDF